MSSNPVESDRQMESKGLVEFGLGSSTALAPFEDECNILLDEHAIAGMDLLDEFDEAVYFGDQATPEEEEGETPESPEDTAPSEEAEEEGPADAEVDEEVPEEGMAPEKDWEPAVEEPEVVPEPASPVIGFVCQYAVDPAGSMNTNGQMASHPLVHIVRVPCAGMVKPGWLKLALDRGASGAFVVSCSPGSCYHRTGACVLEDRWHGTRRPMLPSRCDRARLKLLMAHPDAQAGLLREIDSFLVELGRLDAPPSPDAAPEEEQDEMVEIIDLPM